LKNATKGITVTQWLHDIKPNRNAYKLAYACIHYFIPYWNNRSALKYNHFADIKLFWRYWIHMFIASGKHNYAAMSVRFLHILESLHPDVVKVYEEYKVFSFSGEDGTGIPCDAMMELVYILYLCDKYYIFIHTDNSLYQENEQKKTCF
jgi:hypothetical protein